MALKYYIEYNDVSNFTHRFELYDDDFVGSATEVNGKVFLDYPEVDSPLEARKGSGLGVELEANSSLTYSDLYSEKERSFPVIYKRDNIVKFNGFLNPEGWFEDYVTDNWIVRFDCIDGLSFLSSLSLVDNTTGLIFTGIKTQLEVVSLILIRTGLQQNINVDIDIFYTGLAETNCILDNVNILMKRFVKDDGATIMDCETVLESILEPYGACVTTRDGEWFITKPNQLYSSSTITYFRYDYLGVALSPTTGTLDTSFSLGSDVNGFYPHHCSSNQKIRNEASIGAYRISYKYGLIQSFFDNAYLYTADGISVDDWVLVSFTNLTLPPAGGSGVFFNLINYGTGVLNIQSDAVTLAVDLVVELFIRLEPVNTLSFPGIFYYQLHLYDGVDDYYLDYVGAWSTATPIKKQVVINESGEMSVSIKTDVLPIAGDLRILIYTPETIFGETPDVNDVILIKEVTLNNEGDQGANIEGETHTFQITDKPSSKIKDIKEVTTGDNPSDIYLGTMYKADATTPTETWFRSGVVESLPILGLMGFETMRMSQKPARVFSGGVFGFYDYLSTVTIDGLTGKFICISYSYDTKENIIESKFIEIFGDELLDVDYEKTFDYGNVVKPTIKG